MTNIIKNGGNVIDKAKILIIDDEIAICETLSYILEEKGYFTAAVGTGYEAIEKIRQNIFDVALIDVKLPDLEGTELLKEFKKNYPEMVCIIITGYASLQDTIKAFKDGADGYFLKPTIVEEVLHKVEEALAKQHLKKELVKSATIIHDMSDALVIIDSNGKVNDVNPAFEKLTGYKKNEVVGNEALNIIKKINKSNDFNKVIKFTKNFMKGKNSTTETFSLITKNGEKLTAVISSSFLKDLKGKPTKIIVTIKDISELEKAERKYSTIIQTALDGFWIHDLEGRFIDVNDSYCQMIGYTRKELLTMSISDIEAIDKLEEIAEHIKKVFEQGYDRFETQHRCKNGKIINVEVSTNYIDVKGGQMFVFIRDITNFKKAQQKIKESEEKYRGLYNSLKDGVLMTDILGNILESNQAFRDMIGYSEEEIKKLTYQQITPIKWHEKEKEIVEELIKKSGYSDIYMKEYIKKDGTIVPITIRVWLIKDEQGNLKGMWGIVSDVTEIVKLQQELLEKSKLAAVGQLAAGIAHELNTPLANVNLTAEYILSLVKTKKFIQDPIILQNELKDIKNQVNNCAQIVKNLLQFSRKMILNKKVFKLNSLLTELVESPIISSRIKENGINLIIKPNEIIDIEGDRELLFQVLQNLVNNSFDALEEIKNNPEITITMTKVNSNIEIKVIDNGTGIKETDLQRLFEPFFSTKPVGKGTGLGLAICRGIIERHEGQITISSTFEKGTEVMITLPL